MQWPGPGSSASVESGPAPPSPPQPGALVWPTPLSLGPQPIATSSLGRAGAPLSLEPPQSTGHPHGPEHTTLPHPPRHPLVYRPLLSCAPTMH